MPRHAPIPPVTPRLRALLGQSRGPSGGGLGNVANAREAAVAPGVIEGWGPRQGRAAVGWLPHEPRNPDGERHQVELSEAAAAPWAGGDGGDGGAEAGGDGGAEAGGDGGAEGGRHRPRAAPRFVMTPLALRGARVHVSWLAVTGLGVVLLLAALVFAARVAQAERTSAPEALRATSTSPIQGRSVPSAFASGAAGSAAAAPKPVAAPRGSPSSASAASSPTTGPSPGAASGGAASARAVVVHVVGQVARPGVVTLPEGSRVVDALAVAGGAQPGADLQRVNLARLLVDGEQVYVPRPGESVPATASGATGGSAATAGPGASAAAGSPGALVDLNTADVSALDGLPGVGPVLAKRIVEWRTQHGRFTTIDELGEVSGIGDKLLEQVRSRVRV